jgi:Fe-Mn family superoxide dismutase
MLDFIKLLEGKAKPSDIEIIPLNFTPREVSWVMSKDTLDLHYEKLAKGYATRYNTNEGDKDFNYAGVFLHNLWFTQFKKVELNNTPNGPIKNFIDKHYNSFDSFKEKLEGIAMGIQGSGWVYLATDGNIKTIKNH